MNICRIFILRPVATTLLAFAFLVAGYLSYRAMSVADMPNISVPVIYVLTSQPGGTPEQIAASITAPLERRLGMISGLTSIQSDSSEGNAFLLLFFDDSRNVDGAARDVQAALQAARQDMPSTLRDTPQYYKANPSDFPILLATLTSPTRPLTQLRDITETQLRPMLSQIKGVGWVELVGSTKPAVRVEMNPLMLYKFGLGFEDIRSNLSSANANTPKGIVDQDGVRYMLQTNDQARSSAQYRDLVVGYRNQRPIRLTDIATVRDGPEDERRAAWYNGEPAVVAVIRAQPGANVINITDAIKARAPQLQAGLPADVTLTLASDRSLTIRSAVKDTQLTLVISVVLVILVVLCFLRTWRSTIIPAITVPISLAGALAFMHLLGFSLDTLSLMALTIATGFVVDDAIVVVENIARHMEDGMPRLEASLKGAREISFTVLAITISLIAVFLPLLLLGGTAGKVLFEFAMTLALAVTVSLVLSLSLTPMMCALFLHVHEEDSLKNASSLVRAIHRLFDGFDFCLQKLMNLYSRTLDFALRHRRFTLSSLPVSLAATIGIVIVMPKTIIPAQDVAMIEGMLRADQTASFSSTAAKAQQVMNVMRKDPDVTSVIAFAGEDAANEAQVFATLSDKWLRHSTPEDINRRIQDQFGSVAGLQINLSNVGDINGGGGRQHEGNYNYVLQSDNADDIYKWTPLITEVLKSSKVLTDVTTHVSDAASALHVDIMRDTAARYLITPQLISNTLFDAFGQRTASTISTTLTTYYVVMEVAKEFRLSPEVLNSLWISTSGGTTGGGTASNTIKIRTSSSSSTASTQASLSAQSLSNQIANSLAGGNGASSGSAVSSSTETMIPLRNVARLSSQPTSLTVSHHDGTPSGQIAFNLPKGRGLSDASKEIEDTMRRLHVPSSLRGGFSGQAADFQKSMINQLLILGLAIATMYVTLGILYESYIHPLTILSTLPSAAVGAVLALWISGQQFSLIAMIGVIMLIGIVKKNAILMIDFALHAERDQGMTPDQAIREACIKRFRPILMTTLAAAFGAIPLVVSNGYGAELRRPLGIAVIGGLAMSQLLTLYTTPVVYLYMERLSAYSRRKFRRRSISTEMPSSQLS